LVKGAIVDQRGGTLNGTPLHWAIRYAWILLAQSCPFDLCNCSHKW